MDNPKARSKPPPLESSPRNPNSERKFRDAQIAAKKLDDRIDGERRDAAGRRLERQHSRRISFFPSQRNLGDASPSFAIRKIPPIRFIGNAKNPPTDSPPASHSGGKEPPCNRESCRMSKTTELLKRDLEAKALARGLRSFHSARHLGASSPPIRNVGAKKAPPPISEANLKQPPLPGPNRKMSRGDFQPSRIPHFVPSRLQGSQVELEMRELNCSSTGLKGMTPSKRKGDDDSKRPGLLSPSKSAQKLTAPSFRRNTVTRESSMSVLRRSATTNSRDLNQLIAYKTGIALENPNEERTEETKPPTVRSAANRDGHTSKENDMALTNSPPCPKAPSLSGMTNNRDLDELIAYKTGIPLEDNPGEKETCEVAAKPTLETAELKKNAEHSSQFAKAPIVADLGQDVTTTPEDKEAKSTRDFLGGITDDWVEEEDLAIAIEVQEEMDEEDAFHPFDIQYDPEAKTPIYKRRPCFLILSLGILVIIIAGALAFALSPSKHSREVELPNKTQHIKSIIELVVDRESLQDPDTPYFAALDWITNLDKLQVGVENPIRLIQRYVLALFYFQTKNWYSCGAANETLGEDGDSCNFQQLISFYPHRYRSLFSYRWLSSKHECEWAGIACDDSGSVQAMRLVGQNIRGKLPKEFKELEFLNSILLQWNDFTGTIPEEYGDMKHLQAFVVHHNHLTGTLPEGFFVGMRNLRALNVGRNFLTGTIPASIKNIVGLHGLYLFSNAFQGQIPDEIGDLSVLSFIRLDKNLLTGTLPSTLGRLHVLELGMSRQNISGTLPPELGNMSSLKSIDLHSTLLNGTIPEEFYNMTGLQTLDLYDSSLSGTLSTSIGSLTDLRTLRINGNHLSGELPAELGDLSRLGELWIHGNEFKGVVPIEVCSLKELESLEVVNADCLPMDDTGIAQISCDCCDNCCSPQSEACKSFDG